MGVRLIISGSKCQIPHDLHKTLLKEFFEYKVDKYGFDIIDKNGEQVCKFHEMMRLDQMFAHAKKLAYQAGRESVQLAIKEALSK